MSLTVSYAPAAAVIGVAMRKLNRAADSRVSPTNRPVEIEIPERLIPGMSASAWAQPMISARREGEAVDRPRSLAPRRSASHMIAAPMSSVIATRPADRMVVSIEVVEERSRR